MSIHEDEGDAAAREDLRHGRVPAPEGDEVLVHLELHDDGTTLGMRLEHALVLGYGAVVRHDAPRPGLDLTRLDRMLAEAQGMAFAALDEPHIDPDAREEAEALPATMRAWVERMRAEVLAGYTRVARTYRDGEAQRVANARKWLPASLHQARSELAQCAEHTQRARIVREFDAPSAEVATRQLLADKHLELARVATRQLLDQIQCVWDQHPLNAVPEGARPWLRWCAWLLVQRRTFVRDRAGAPPFAPPTTPAELEDARRVYLAVDLRDARDAELDAYFTATGTTAPPPDVDAMGTSR